MSGLNKRAAELAEQAKQLDRQIRAVIEATHRSLTELGAMLFRMRELRLWQHLPGEYTRFEDYVRDVVGPMSRSTLHETVTAYSLIHGSNPIPAAMVNDMGIKKAAELARLEPAERTPELIQAALEERLPIVRKKVQDRINEKLPPDERKEVKVAFVRHFAPSVIQQYDDFMRVAIWMEGIRDTDRTLTLEEKVLLALIADFRANFSEELEDAEQHMIALSAKKNADVKDVGDENGAGNTAPPKRPKSSWAGRSRQCST